MPRIIVLASIMLVTVATALACGRAAPDASSPKVINGMEVVESDWPTTARLAVFGTRLCTGTFLNDTTVLTARHCIDTTDPTDPTGRVVVQSGANAVQSLRAFVAPGADPSRPDASNYETDLALVVFPVGTGAGRNITQYPMIAPRRVAVGTQVWMLGFGGTAMNGEGAGKLRLGSHAVMFSDDAGFSWVAAPSEQNVAPGDSGSAGYADGYIVGVATLAGEVGGIVRLAGFRGLHDRVAQDLFESAVHCGGEACAAEFR